MYQLINIKRFFKYDLGICYRNNQLVPLLELIFTPWKTELPVLSDTCHDHLYIFLWIPGFALFYSPILGKVLSIINWLCLSLQNIYAGFVIHLS